MKEQTLPYQEGRSGNYVNRAQEMRRDNDIIKFDEKYYEVDNMKTTQYWMGRNNETLPINTEGRGNREFGYNIAIVAQTHLTRISQLDLVEFRTGVNTNRNNHSIPKNL